MQGISSEHCPSQPMHPTYIRWNENNETVNLEKKSGAMLAIFIELFISS